MAKKDDKKRAADKAAGKGSFADRLRKRRRALEGGDVTGGGFFKPGNHHRKD